MKNIIEFIKVSFWKLCRNIKALSVFSLNKKSACDLGFHKMRRGFGWSRDKRMDICLRVNCNYHKWYKDELGYKLLKLTIAKTTPKD